MKYSATLFFILLLQNAFAQFPFQKQWDYRYGGTDYDFVSSFSETNDGGFIIGGYSQSPVSGDKTQPNWGQLDYWIIKIDAAGIKEWDKRFGGMDQDVLSAVEQTADGGYFLAGYSASQAGGDKTQPSRGFNDYWIIKTDSLGNKIWDKRYGGDMDDMLAMAFEMSDGGYILGGYSSSGINGDKTTPNRGLQDFWIVRTDSIGTVLWDKDFGGTDYDFMYNMILTGDGGFLLGGSSSSPAGFDKTQNTWGANDAWVVKTDSLGNKEWDADFGGFDYDQVNSLCQTSDGSYLLACHSQSGISGNKTQNTWGTGDLWLIKIDSTGAKQWDRDFGGSSVEDGIGSVFEDKFGGYYLSLNSFSPISGNKTENNLGISQAWILKIDTAGNLLWDKTIFTDPEQKVFPMMIQTADSCYAISQASFGDVAGYKTQPNWDALLMSPDFWIIRYCDTTLITTAAFVAPNSVCPGTCIDFTNLSNYATSYLWSFPGSNTLTSTDVNPQGICYPTPGNYDVTLIATGALGIDTLTLSNYITVYPVPPPQGILQSGDTLFANLGAVNYQWFFNGNIIPGATNYYHVALMSGNYNIIATDSNGCEVEAAIFDVIAGIHSPASESVSDISAFPNPATDELHIQYSGEIKRTLQLDLYNTSGTCVLKTDFSSGVRERVLNISTLSPGLYMITISGEGNMLKKKIQILHSD